jgi:hypothetical protein
MPKPIPFARCWGEDRAASGVIGLVRLYRAWQACFRGEWAGQGQAVYLIIFWPNYLLAESTDLLSRQVSKWSVEPLEF